MAAPSGLAALVVIPAYNEEATIAGVVAAVRGLGYPVVVVNDASTDGTVAAARRAGAEVLDLPLRQGAWGAALTGFLLASRRGVRVVVTMDADGQHSPADLEALLVPIEEDRADLVIGSCVGRGSALRKFAWRLFRALSGLCVQDLTSGFRAYGPRAARAMLTPETVLADYQDLGVLLLARRRALRVEEIPVRMCPRSVGKSHVFSSWLQVARYMAYTAVLAGMRR